MFNLKGRNHEVVLTSERYTTKASALGGMEAVRLNARDGARFVRRRSTSDEAYFVLRGANHEVIGTSELYSSNSARDSGIEPVMACAPTAVIDDETVSRRG